MHRELERLRAEVAEWRRATRSGESRDIAFTNSASASRAALHGARRRPRRSAGSARRPRRLSVHARHSCDRISRQAVDDAAVRRLRQRRATRTRASSSCSSTGRRDCRSAFDFPTLMGYDSDHPRSLGEVGKMRRRDLEPGRHGNAVRRHSARPGVDVDDDQRSGDHSLVLLHRRRGKAGRVDSTKLRGTIQNDILKEYMAQHAWCLSDRTGAAAHRRRLRVGRDARAAVEYDLDFRLPHSRGRFDGGAGAGVHARRRLHLRRARHRARTGRRRLRAAALVLLGHPQRFLRGDRQVARGAPHLGAPPEGTLRREEIRARG